jgi:hypothetical protein
MLEDLYFPPGKPVRQPGPIERFLPPLEHGAVSRILPRSDEGLGLILDPFGTSPQLAREAAQAGAVVLIASNNPITRFLIRQNLSPPSQKVLQSALAQFASLPKNGSRMEPFLLDLYRTTCSRCGAFVSADYFIWGKEDDSPSQKAYRCHSCAHTALERTTEVDQGRARAYAQSGLHYAMALEALAPAGDPYRKHAEAALQVYPGRSLYALVTLLSKLDQFDTDRELGSAARALLLFAFDACNALWDYPEGRATPRQLSPSTQFRERNAWYALESAVDVWSFEKPTIPIFKWPLGEMPPGGSVVIYPGSAKQLIANLPQDLRLSLVTVLPRPNHAYWTLAALWSSWLWGRESAKSIKVALRRRRYDWAWHARALMNVLASITPALHKNNPIFTILAEVEPGFLAAALAGLDEAGLKLKGRALRDGENHALLEWATEPTPTDLKSPGDLASQMQRSVHETLTQRGEPASYDVLHAAALMDLAHQRILGQRWQSEGGSPRTYFGSILEGVLFERKYFERGSRGSEAEVGQYWLAGQVPQQRSLSDRVEMYILERLRKEQLLYPDLIEAVYRTFSGLMSPDRRLVEICLDSYAEYVADSDYWALRPEDHQPARDQDCEEIETLLTGLGERLGFEVYEDGLIYWRAEDGNVAFAFRVQATAILEEMLEQQNPDLTIVLPGGRSTIVLEKARRDIRINEWLERGPRIIKFRHVRRLSTETTLQRDNFAQRLAIDPPDQHDPQLPLL